MVIGASFSRRTNLFDASDITMNRDSLPNADPGGGTDRPGGNAASRAGLEEAVRVGLRAFIARATVFNYQVAEQTGLNPTDLQFLGLLQLHGPLSAGALARATGLTTSATTAVIDRLERGGFAAREHDPADRRRVIVRLNQQHHDDTILPLYAAKAPGAATVLARFSDEQLATVAAFLEALEHEAGAAADRPS
jgi:DNA-binding MarR family transcriptional regulator